ncbi:uncharacterized protein LOC111346047 [Stylophora pistillata]|uniref:uncharacterized protein LOC111346047 n=1 Tax=Stylophora pistillata TaxID=50429 RepID=UPI000C0468D8|nr:uncharacterized protein LOC111346047 [Stylophora pistillata]XP_022809069.1 uncharacterized protein LOC111346047 [Stylophora pistillata]
MEETIANTSSIDLTVSGNGHHTRDVEELLLQIVQDIGGGGELPLELLDRIVCQRTGHTISTLVDCGERDVLECIQSNLSPQSSLIVSLENRLLSVKRVEQILNCCAESDVSLEMVNKGTTTLDLSRRCVSSNELLETCKPARMLRHLILNDIQIQPGSKEPLAFSLIERIKWYCPALKKVETTGCSQAVYEELFQNGKNAHPSAFGVKVEDLLETKPEVKELLDPLLAKREVADIANRIKALVQEGVPANITFDGWSLLHTAVVIGDKDLVTWLLKRSSSFKFRLKNSTRPTALEVAIRCHNEAIVAELLGATDVVDPAWLACICFSEQFPKVNERGVRERHHHECNPLQVAGLFLDETKTLEFKTTFLIQIIIEFQIITPRELREKTCWTEEYLAEMLKHLVSAGCSLNVPIKDLGRKTPLMCTVSSPVLLKTLVDLGADIHATDEMGNTALFYAVADATVETRNEHIETTKLLLENKAEPNVINKHGQTSILFDASKERSNKQLEEFFSGYKLPIWNLLIQSGAKLTTTNTEDRKSLLHLAVEHSKEYLEKYQGRSDPGIIEPRCAANWCVQIIKFVSEHDEKLLMSLDMSGNTALHLWAGHYSRHAPEMEAIGQALIEVGSNVKVRNHQGKTPLHLAKLWSVAEFLLKQRSKPNVTDYNDRTPLLCKCIEANQEPSPRLEEVSSWAQGINLGMDPWKEDKVGQNVFKVLIKNSCFLDLERFIDVAINTNRESIFRTDNRGNTLLHLLCNCNNSRVLPLIDLVLKFGVKVDAQNKEGDTGLHIACRKEMHLPPRKGNISVHKRVILKVLAYGARSDLKNKKNTSARNLVWLNKRLLAMLKNDRQRKQPLHMYPWVSQSSNHKERLSMVARGQDVRKIDNYSYSGPIGSGASSMVFAAINVLDGREVALKRIETRSPTTRQADREMNSLLQLSNSDHIVQYFNIISDTDFTWIVLELMEGTLNDLSLLNSSVTKLSKDVLQGMEYLHRNNILHRDLKPGNVLYTTKPRLRLKISDFGLSKRVDGGEGSSVLHSNAGTRVWMAPELLSSSGHPQHSFASDIFSLGLVLHFILANKRHPFTIGASGLPNSLAECNIVETNITTGRLTLSPDLSDEGKDLLEMVLTGNRDERPNALAALKHPLFWIDETKIAFITAVANQKEIGEYGRAAPSLVEKEIERKVGTMLSSKWDRLFPTLYAELTSSGRGRRYDTKSGVHLIRFMRNAYAHVSDRTRSTEFQKQLLTDRIFLTTLPKLFMIVFNAVKHGNWHDSRAEISKVFNG